MDGPAIAVKHEVGVAKELSVALLKGEGGEVGERGDGPMGQEKQGKEGGQVKKEGEEERRGHQLFFYSCLIPYRSTAESWLCSVPLLVWFSYFIEERALSFLRSLGEEERKV